MYNYIECDENCQICEESEGLNCSSCYDKSSNIVDTS